MDYFTQLREGHAIVRRLKRLAREAHHAPSYVCGSWDPEEDDWEPEPNESPHNAFHDALAAAWDHPVAAAILRAWGWHEDSGIFYASFIRNTPSYGDRL